MAQFCAPCGTHLGEGMRFCPACGAAAGDPAAPAPQAPIPVAPVAQPTVVPYVAAPVAAPTKTSGDPILKVVLAVLGPLLLLLVVSVGAGVYYYYHGINPKVAPKLGARCAPSRGRSNRPPNLPLRRWRIEPKRWRIKSRRGSRRRAAESR
jgi:hypothetical protein